jgi:hypothetical protein
VRLRHIKNGAEGVENSADSTSLYRNSNFLNGHVDVG